MRPNCFRRQPSYMAFIVCRLVRRSGAWTLLLGISLSASRCQLQLHILKIQIGVGGNGNGRRHPAAEAAEAAGSRQQAPGWSRRSVNILSHIDASMWNIYAIVVWHGVSSSVSRRRGFPWRASLVFPACLGWLWVFFEEIGNCKSI